MGFQKQDVKSVLNVLDNGWFHFLLSAKSMWKGHLASQLNIYSTHPLWLHGWQKQSYSDNDNLLGLLRLVVERKEGCLFWPDFAVSVGSGIRVGGCVGPEEAVMKEASDSVFDCSGATTGGCSLGLRPLFLPVVAPFLTSALIKLFSAALLLLLETTWLAAARNQF